MKKFILGDAEETDSFRLRCVSFFFNMQDTLVTMSVRLTRVSMITSKDFVERRILEHGFLVAEQEFIHLTWSTSLDQLMIILSIKVSFFDISFFKYIL